jgi:hypothetical protein
MSLAKKLNVRAGMTVRVVGKPGTLDLDDVPTTRSPNAESVVVFVTTIDELREREAGIVAAARDRLTWVAYPKAGQLATDLNRDILSKHLQARGLDGVRQVALDSVWSAIRFRSAQEAA